MKTRWKGVLIRVADAELLDWDGYCEKNRIKRVDLVRSSVRFFMANPEIVNGVVKRGETAVDLAPILGAMGELKQKLEMVEKKVSIVSTDKGLSQCVSKKKLAEAVLEFMQHTRNNVTTLDRLIVYIRKAEPQLAPFLSSGDGGLCLLDEVLTELNDEGKVEWDFGEVVRFIEQRK